MRERTALGLLLLTLVTSTACKRTEDATGGDGGTASAAATGAGATPAAGTALGSGFEGAITVRVTSGTGHAEDLTFLTKAGKLRMDPPAHGAESGHVLFDPAAKKMTMILDTQKMYMDLTPSVGAAVANAPAHAGGTPPKVTDTGKHDTVAGYDCEILDIAESNGKRADVCVSQGAGFFDFMGMGTAMGGGPGGPGAGGASRAWADVLKDRNGFPLRVVETDASGKETSRMEATKIEKKTLDDSMFAIPAGYHPMQIPHFGGPPGAGGMPNMPNMPNGQRGPSAR